jgi:hypothetical protein
LYLQQRNNDSGNHKKDWHSQSSQLNRLPINNLPMFKPPNFNVAGPSGQSNYNMMGQSRPHFQPPQGWRPNPTQGYQFRGPTRTQQIFRGPPPNYNPQSNVFRNPNRPQTQSSNFNGPKPMSGVTPFTSKPLPPSGHDWRRFGNPPPNNYFKTREVNFNETDGDYNVDYEHSEYNYPEFEYNYDYYDSYSSFSNYENYHPSEGAIVEELDSQVPPENENFQKGSNSDKLK